MIEPLSDANPAAARLMRALDRVNAMLNEMDPGAAVAHVDAAAGSE